MYKTEQKRQASKEQKELQYKLENLIKANTNKINEIKDELKHEIDIVKNGVLSVQKRNFEQQCHALLEEGHEITLAEFEQIQEEHKTYNSLGGNHDGDIIFEMVVHKANKNIIE